jgi:ACS family hexuronate transporter-like MFS transporter
VVEGANNGQRNSLGVRWTICALLFCATTLNYYNRQILGLLKPDLQHVFGWSERDYSVIVMGFQFAYACGLLTIGRIVDVLGSRVALAVSVAIWSIASLAHAFVASVAGFVVVRMVLGLAEAGNFPASVSSVSQWFPRRESALAIGLFNAGSNVGAILAALTVPLVADLLGWRGAFVVAGALGAVWVAVWVPSYRRPEHHSRVTKEELAWINSDKYGGPKRAKPLCAAGRERFIVALCVARGLTDPVWTFLLFWSPDFFARQFGLSLRGLAFPIVGIYLAADIGGIVGGQFSSKLIGRGFTAARARLIVMFCAAALTSTLIIAPRTPMVALAALVIALGALAHQAWSANVYALISDHVPTSSVGTVVGVTGAVGALGGMAMAAAVGYLLDRAGGYKAIFASIVVLYLTGWFVLWRAVRRHDLPS